MRTARRRTAAVVIVLVALLAAAAWTFGRPLLDRRHDVAARRALYGAFPVYPGAVKAGERSYEIRGDGVPTGDYGLTVTYWLPAGSTAAEVIAFVRRNLPPGWKEASDQTCANLEATMAPAPAPAPTLPGDPTPPTTGPRTGLALLRQENQLTAFAPSGDGRGVSFNVTTGGRSNVLTLDDVTFACAPR